VDAVAVPSAGRGLPDRYLWIGLTALGVVVLLSVLAGAIMASRISRPMRNIAEDLRRVGSFDLSENETIRSAVREVATLSEYTTRMKMSLRSFARYVPTDLVRDLLSRGGEARLGGVVRPLTLFFSDVAGFTTASEGKAPQEVVEALGDYLHTVVAALTEAGGTVDKFVGDGVVAFFNAPKDDAHHAASACRAALSVQAALAGARAAWTSQGQVRFGRIGLHGGGGCNGRGTLRDDRRRAPPES
jgi:adenylate cyclase